MSKIRIKKNDIVTIIAGDERGKSGKVLAVMRDKNRVIVEGCALIKKHQKKTQQNPQGGIVEKEGTIHVSNVMLKTAFDERAGEKKPAGAPAVEE